MTRGEAIDMVGYVVDDGRSCRHGELTGEFTKDDVRESGRKLLRELMDEEPTTADIDEAMRI